MKSKLLIITFFYLFSFSRVEAQSVNVSVGFQTFYDQLSPYGTWVNYPQYGYVWRYRPASGEFRPYSTNGRWVYTDDGWTWVSGYDWGWAPFHYGRWLYDDGLGWLWVPGNEWAPAWVTWGSYNDNFAWAPIGPGISISFGNNNYRPPANYWTVVPGNYFGRSDWHDHAIRNSDRVTIVNKVTIINNYNRPGNGRTGVAYYRGPDTKSVERYTKAAVRPVRITDAARPGNNRVQNDRVAFYRPKVNDDRRNAKPAKPADAAQLRRESPQNNRPQPGQATNHERPAIIPAQPAKPVTPAPVPPQQRPGNRQPPPRGITPRQTTPATPVNRATDRRAEESKKERDRAVQPNRAALPSQTPVSPAPVNSATDRRPESGRNLPQHTRPSKPTEPAKPVPAKPVQPRTQRPAPAQPRPAPQRPVTNKPVEQRPQRPAPQTRPAEVKPPHGN